MLSKQLAKLLFLWLIATQTYSFGQSNSAAREWNSMILEAIRNDFARPTVHARNLFHHSIMAYDLWAAFDPTKETYFLGKTINGFDCSFSGIDIPYNIHSAREKAISFASYRFITNRYNLSPNYAATLSMINDYMVQHNYDVTNTSTDFSGGGAAELGNYIAEQIQLFGFTDGSNHQNSFQSIFYTSQNPPIEVEQPGNPLIQDPNHWQAITLTVSIDQAGNTVSSTPPHLSPEWGNVLPFAMDSTMSQDLTRDGDTYKVYFDPGPPALLDVGDSSAWDSFYKWNHSLVTLWQSHLDPSDGVMWDISPNGIGNNTWYPSNPSEYELFYDLENGGDPSTGHALNPVTGLPYAPQIVPRGDYARVLAEFWADGVDSETPPGHWFEIYHYVTDQPTFERKWAGVGPELDPLEYDVKAHLTLGGATHDAAICAWGLKGYYDYIRPVSAIRYMADQGQSSDTALASYDPNGIPLLDNYIELVEIGDPLAGNWNEHVGKIKLNTWRGPEYISDPSTDIAGVGWILAENWWPYQRPTFVTPPFAGYMSGHSTFSRASAEVLTAITGSAYFPGGMGEFHANQNQFLHFESGPSTNIVLQWATYRDASDQCSLSRIWGGIHPPVDDIPGRLIGMQVGNLAFTKADDIFTVDHPALVNASINDTIINRADIGGQFTMTFSFNTAMDTTISPMISLNPAPVASAIQISQITWLDSFNVITVFDVLASSLEAQDVKVEISNLFTGGGQSLGSYILADYFIVDTKKPLLDVVNSNITVVTDQTMGQQLHLELIFDEFCDNSSTPLVEFEAIDLINPTFTLNTGQSEWINDSTYHVFYDVIDFEETVFSITAHVSNVVDKYGNLGDTSSIPDVFIIDTKNPTIVSAIASDTLIAQNDLVSPQFLVELVFDESMDIGISPTLSFYAQGTSFGGIVQNMAQTSWVDSTHLSVEFLIFPSNNDLTELDLSCNNLFDSRGNTLNDTLQLSVVSSDMKSPETILSEPSRTIISDSLLGQGNYFIDISFSEPMDTTVKPLVQHIASQSLNGSIQYNLTASHYLTLTDYRAFYQILDENIEVDSINLLVQFAKDVSGNFQVNFNANQFVKLDTKNPSVTGIFANDYTLEQLSDAFIVVAIFDEEMHSLNLPVLEFDPIISPPMALDLNSVTSAWVNTSTYQFNFTLNGMPLQSTSFGIEISSATDAAGNTLVPISFADFVYVDNSAVGLNELSTNIPLLYPSILTKGGRLFAKGKFNEENLPVQFEVINTTGQLSQQLTFTHGGIGYASDPISLAPGMYYVKNESYNFKIIVLE